MVGVVLYLLVLGNVVIIWRMLDERLSLKYIIVIGIGGVEDEKGYKRMRVVGVGVVGVGIVLGVKGVEVFEEIEKGLKGGW